MPPGVDVATAAGTVLGTGLSCCEAVGSSCWAAGAAASSGSLCGLFDDVFAAAQLVLRLGGARSETGLVLVVVVRSAGAEKTGMPVSCDPLVGLPMVDVLCWLVCSFQVNRGFEGDTDISTLGMLPVSSARYVPLISDPPELCRALKSHLSTVVNCDVNVSQLHSCEAA